MVDYVKPVVRQDMLLDRSAMELLRSIEMRVKGSSDAANEKALIIGQSQRAAVKLDDTVRNQVTEPRDYSKIASAADPCRSQS